MLAEVHNHSQIAEIHGYKRLPSRNTLNYIFQYFKTRKMSGIVGVADFEKKKNK